MKVFNSVARFIVGGLFIFSGLIKINDPVGTQIKLEEYFTVFAVDIAPFFESLKPLALFLSIFLSTLEIVLGLAVLLKYKPKLTTSLLLAIILFFTFLTFYSAYFNKVTDCGCFGDAIKLTPWQSFIKDIVLLALILVLFINRKKNEVLSGLKVKSIALGGSLVFCLLVSYLAITHLPFIDFRAYKVGTSIPTAMLPPANDPNEVPKITNFAIWSDTGDETQNILTGTKLLVVIHEAEKTDLKAYPDLISLIAAANKSMEIIAITSSSGAQFEALRHEVQLAIPYFYSDATLLKTMIRSNPGLVLLENGTVIKKWHYNDIPAAQDILDELRLWKKVRRSI
ncbi:MAG: DoxX family protein [Cytophagales bacterium CG12_big_fil_rev_8_21_14_0_65_40_12]|nr:MAG: DoxX family protein [Cytophagales bacterium CG12_big_fil_rev_8_21_14_0_65_40_12]PIW06230.1 MAG: DoxX family protein [Cytophagales bacterium CG17_big_fil_post_rev_8_21_14_2_50_40_13]